MTQNAKQKIAGEVENLDQDLPAATEIPLTDLVGQTSPAQRSKNQPLYNSDDERPYGKDQAYLTDEDEEGRVMRDNHSFRRDDDALTDDPANPSSVSPEIDPRADEVEP